MSGKSGFLALLKYLNGQWITIVETGRESQILSQALVSSDEGFPHDRVKKLIETGKRVVKVRYSAARREMDFFTFFWKIGSN